MEQKNLSLAKQEFSPDYKIVSAIIKKVEGLKFLFYDVKNWNSIEEINDKVLPTFLENVNNDGLTFEGEDLLYNIDKLTIFSTQGIKDNKLEIQAKYSERLFSITLILDNQIKDEDILTAITSWFKFNIWNIFPLSSWQIKDKELITNFEYWFKMKLINKDTKIKINDQTVEINPDLINVFAIDNSELKNKKLKIFFEYKNIISDNLVISTKLFDDVNEIIAAIQNKISKNWSINPIEVDRNNFFQKSLFDKWIHEIKDLFDNKIIINNYELEFNSDSLEWNFDFEKFKNLKILSWNENVNLPMKFNFLNHDIPFSINIKIKITETGFSEIYEFFKQAYDWNLTTSNTRQDVLDNIKIYFQKYLKNNYYFKEEQDVIFDLWDNSYNKNINFNEDRFVLSIIINGENISPDTGDKAISIFLKNIKKSDKFLVKEISDYFSKEFDYSEHNLTTSNTRQDAYDLVKKLIAKFIPDNNFHIIYDYENAGHINIKDNSSKVPTGDYFDFILKIYDLKQPLTFKIKNVKNIAKQELEKLKAFFDKEFDYSEHNLTTNNIRHDAYDLIKKLISEFIDYNNFTIHPYYTDDINKRIKAKTALVPTGDYFDFNLEIGEFNEHFRFKIKNVKDLFKEETLKKVSQLFNKEFDYSEHNLTTNSIRQDAYDLIKKLIAKIIDPNDFNIIPDDLNNMNLNIKDNSSKVPTGDYFDFILEFANEKLAYCFKAKNVRNLIREEEIERVRIFFNKEFDYLEHKLTTFNIRQDAYKLIEQLIKSIVPSIFRIVPDDLNNMNVNIKDNSSVVKTGDYFNFTLYLDDFVEKLTFKIKNVKKGDIEEIFNKASTIFQSEFDYWEHKLTNWTNRAVAYNLIKDLIKKNTNIEFEVTFNKDDLYINGYRVRTKSDLVSTGDYFNFILKIGNSEKAFCFKARDVETETVDEVFSRVSIIFAPEFDYPEHKLTNADGRWILRRLATSILKDAIGQLSYERYTISFRNSGYYDFISSSSDLVPTGDYFEFSLNINKQKQPLIFKIKNVKNSIGTLLMPKIIEFFREEIDYQIHHLNNHETRDYAYNFIREQIAAISYTMILNRKFTVTPKNKNNINDKIATSSDLVPTGDYFEFILKISNIEKSLIFKAKNVKQK